jgi:2-aminoadipate transaminase
MSYKVELKDLERAGERSLTEQIVAALRRAIDTGELAPGDKLPPTRELAELAGVNHLTAVRAYRRLREAGLVSSQVGRGTFVREAAPVTAAGGEAGEEWQRYVLPAVSESHGDRAMAEMYRHSQARGLIPLSVGYPSKSLFPFEAMRDSLTRALDRQDARALQYTDIAGLPELVEQLVALSASRGAPEVPENVVVTSGARQGLTIAARAVLRPGDVVACESPSFFGVLESLRATGARVLPVPLDDEGLDLDALEALIAQHELKMVALQTRCQNPTGVDLSVARRARLVEMARMHGFFILEDGIYGDLRYASEDPGPLRGEAPSHVIYVDSVSKIIGGGLRAGWIAASGPVRERILREKRLDDMHSATIPQLALAEFLADGSYPGHLDRARAFYRERRDALIEGIERNLGGLVGPIRPPEGGGHVWLTLAVPVDEGELITEAVRHGVTFVPGAAVLPEPIGGAHMRLSFGFLEPEQLFEGTRRLARAIRSMSKPRAAEAALPIA